MMNKLSFKDFLLNEYSNYVEDSPENIQDEFNEWLYQLTADELINLADDFMKTYHEKEQGDV